ncbi:MAG: hypothetical protein IJ145_02835 [Prevotella sp.]|nr:hypothetical protein [Prevotella sp.]
MKKNYWILAAAAVALAACSNDDTIAVNQGIEEANTINFSNLSLRDRPVQLVSHQVASCHSM